MGDVGEGAHPSSANKAHARQSMSPISGKRP